MRWSRRTSAGRSPIHGSGGVRPCSPSGRPWRQARAGGAASPSAVGLSGQMHGVVLADAALEPVRPAILWADAQGVGRHGRVRSPGQRSPGAAGEPDHPGPGRADPPVVAPVRRVGIGKRAVGAAAQGLAALAHDRGGPDRTQRCLGHAALRRARRAVGHGGDRGAGPGSGPLRPTRLVGGRSRPAS